jgi:hypothetical protein
MKRKIFITIISLQLCSCNTFRKEQMRFYDNDEMCKYSMECFEKWKSLDSYCDAQVSFTVIKKKGNRYVRCGYLFKNYLFPVYEIKVDSIKRKTEFRYDRSYDDTWRENFREKHYSLIKSYTKDSLMQATELIIPKFLREDIKPRGQYVTDVTHRFCVRSLIATNEIIEAEKYDSLMSTRRIPDSIFQIISEHL